jgi:hypothetical protein
MKKIFLVAVMAVTAMAVNAQTTFGVKAGATFQITSMRTAMAVTGKLVYILVRWQIFLFLKCLVFNLK